MYDMCVCVWINASHAANADLTAVTRLCAATTLQYSCLSRALDLKHLETFSGLKASVFQMLFINYIAIYICIILHYITAIRTRTYNRWSKAAAKLLYRWARDTTPQGLSAVCPNPQITFWWFQWFHFLGPTLHLNPEEQSMRGSHTSIG